MDIVVLRIRAEDTKKDYNFSGITNAAIFETKFLSLAEKDSKNVSTETFYKDANETKYLLQEISKNPTRYAAKEYLKWFHTEEITC